MSIAYPLYNAAISLLCNKWFPDNERTLVTAICGLAMPAGNIFAFTMSGLLFSGLNPNPDDVEAIKSAEMKLIFIQNCWITLITIPLFLLIREKPKYPPSLIA